MRVQLDILPVKLNEDKPASDSNRNDLEFIVRLGCSGDCSWVLTLVMQVNRDRLRAARIYAQLCHLNSIKG